MISEETTFWLIAAIAGVLLFVLGLLYASWDDGPGKERQRAEIDVLTKRVKTKVRKPVQRLMYYRGYTLEITSVAVDVKSPFDRYLVIGVTLREAMLAIHHDRKQFRLDNS